MATETFYDVLGVPEDADSEAIKRAYRAIARRCHPDIAGDDPSASSRFQAACKAHKVLGDPDARARYDQSIATPASVGDLLLRHRRGSRVLRAMLPTAPAEPKPGTHLARVEGNAERWERVAGDGDRGQNGAPGGDLFLVPRRFVS